ncbi:hypothetical protein SAMN05216516_102192 [Izhakiella capsodis]|uniref:Uncharacterized protein n=1 Tax=Izhakiella capsodis TaxID=1367852 RepID=A0A1I4W133_9GAMM|nr:hypothetical protein SAMN05216516_102192 [Izhakiella capsodis]
MTLFYGANVGSQLLGCYVLYLLKGSYKHNAFILKEYIKIWRFFM